MIRRATPDDAAEVAHLLHDFNSEYEDHTPGVEALTGHYRELIGADQLTVMLAVGAGDADAPGCDGFAQFRLKRSHYTGRPDAHVEELYVVPGRRGRGIGRALLEATIAAAREAGATHIELTTGEDDVEARSLYESAGFSNREGGDGGPRMLYYEREL
jgi:ribosomal protein S18 acetylase RimI-like enzyme